MIHGLDAASVGAVPTLAPASLEEVVAAVATARRERRPLYPISTGLNWGYGASTPPVAGSAVLDLSRMNRILNAGAISPKNPVAVIEPGVTQRQLADFLANRCPELTFNPTGSAADTSILGNALDRGVGYYGPRVDDIFGLEVVTGTGEVIRTGMRRLGDASPLATVHRHGLGPSLDGLFFQGGFGIVTSACLRLNPRRARHVALSIAPRRAADLSRFIDVLAVLRREGVLTSVTHIGNAARTRATLTAGMARYFREVCGHSEALARSEAAAALTAIAPGEWAALAALAGSAAQVRIAVAEIRARLRGIATVRVVTDRRLALGYAVANALRALPPARRIAAAIAAVTPLHGLVHGTPTDVAVNSLLWEFGATHLPAPSLDESRCGLLYVNPALPMDGAFVARFVDRMKAEAAGFGFDLPVTINVETETSVVAIANLVFDKADPTQVERAKRCAASMYALIRGEGLEVYRARVDMMSDVVDATSPYWQAVRRLKLALDPDDIIAPGRYSLQG